MFSAPAFDRYPLFVFRRQGSLAYAMGTKVERDASVHEVFYLPSESTFLYRGSPGSSDQAPGQTAIFLQNSGLFSECVLYPSKQIVRVRDFRLRESKSIEDYPIHQTRVVDHV